MQEYMGPCAFNLHISLVMNVRVCVHYLIIIKLELWINSHCLGLGHETMVRVVGLAFLLTKVLRM